MAIILVDHQRRKLSSYWLLIVPLVLIFVLWSLDGRAREIASGLYTALLGGVIIYVGLHLLRPGHLEQEIEQSGGLWHQLPPAIRPTRRLSWIWLALMVLIFVQRLT